MILRILNFIRGLPKIFEYLFIYLYESNGKSLRIPGWIAELKKFLC